MKIELSAGDKFNIPENCKVTIEDNQIIIEEQKEEFKDGDILRSVKTGTIVIFSNYREEDKVLFDSYFNSINNSNSAWVVESFRHATEEEKQKFFDELNEKGLRWNAETKELEKIRKRVKEWGTYLKINAYGEILEVTECGCSLDGQAFNIGNYYLPEEREQAEADAQKIRAIFQERLK